MAPRVSSFCSGGDCVEVALTRGGNVRARSTRPDHQRRFVTFTPDEWAAFVAGVKNAEFDYEALSA